MNKIQSTSSPDSEDLIRDFLKTCHSGVLATADASSNPHAATVYFSTDDDFNVIFATKTETQKYEDMKENKQVAFTCSDEAAQTAVQIDGVIEKVTDPDEHQAALNRMYRFSEKLSQSEFPPIEKLFAGDYVTLKIVPQVIKMGVFIRPDSESNEDMYEIISFDRTADTEEV